MLDLYYEKNKQIFFDKKQADNAEQQKKHYKIMKDFYKDKSNMVRYLKDRNCVPFIENFELINYIGSGSSGVVYEGKSRKESQKRVCLKFLLNKTNEERRDKNYKNKMGQKIKEIYFQDKLRDKNIAEYYDYYNVKDYGCIVMEFAKFGDIDYFQKKLIQKKYLSETLLAYITKQILNGLLYIHQSKIIHMDIKQQNILIDQNLNIKITDFSVSFSYEQYKENSKIKLPLAGTSLYMSPEVLGKSEIDYEDCSKIDMFSLGVLLFNLAFEQFPYGLEYSDKRNFEAMLRKINTKTLVFPDKKNFSFLFRKFLSGLLDKNIKERLSVYDALEDPWVKGADILFKEKEKLFELEKFLIIMITDNIRAFNDYLRNNSSDTFHTSN